ncbi:MAG: glycosyltransferase, partial [Halieaceae bacterium]
LRTVEAYRAGRQEGLFNWPLVIVGAPGWKSEKEHQAIDALCADGMAMYLRYLDDATLHQLYAATGSLVFPSLYEGFGLPAIEAQASGSRVLTSRGSAMEEFVDPSALLVDPLDTDEIKRGLHEAFANTSIATVADAVSRTWREVAVETAAVYRRSALPDSR